MYSEYFSNLSCLSELELKCAMLGKEITDPEITKNFNAFDSEETTWYFIDSDGNAVLFGNPEPKSICEFAFCDCMSLTSVSIPASVMSISDDAFSDCTSLKSVNLPSSMKNVSVSTFPEGCKIDKMI